MTKKQKQGLIGISRKVQGNYEWDRFLSCAFAITESPAQNRISKETSEIDQLRCHGNLPFTSGKLLAKEQVEVVW